MVKFSKGEIERAIRKARKHLAQRQPPSPVRPRPTPSDRAGAKLVTDWLKSSGLDLKALEAIQQRRQAETERAIPQRAAEAAKRWDSHIKQIQAGVTAQLQSYQSAAAAGDIFPDGLGALDTPIAILVSDDKILKNRHIERLNSSAKIVVDRRESAGHR